MKLFGMLCAGMALVWTLAAGVVARAAEFDGTIRLGGSTTLLPLMADYASQFMEKYETWDNVDPALPKKQILIFVTGGGSGFGVNSAIGGTMDIGMSSRDIKEKEKGTDPARIGDLVVFGDRETMFGEMDNAMEELPDTYRAHGSLHKMELPLIIYNFKAALPQPEYFTHNLDLTRFLFRA